MHCQFGQRAGNAAQPVNPMKQAAAIQDPLYVSAIERAMAVLRVLGQSGMPMGTSEVARAAGLTQSTTWRICYTLHKLGYLQSDAQGHFRPGLPLLALGHAALANNDAPTIAAPLLEDLANRFNGVAALAVRDHESILFVARAQSRAAMLTMNLHTGSRVSILTTAMGWALLAAMPRDERDVLVAALRKRHGKEPAGNQKQMEEQMRSFPQQGFILNIEIFHPNVGFAAVPFTHPATGETLILNCGGVLSTLPKGILADEVGPALRDAASLLREALGGRTAHDKQRGQT